MLSDFDFAYMLIFDLFLVNNLLENARCPLDWIWLGWRRSSGGFVAGFSTCWKTLDALWIGFGWAGENSRGVLWLDSALVDWELLDVTGGLK